MESIPEFRDENDVGEEEGEEEEEEEEGNEEEGEAEDDFETAWNILDVARIIFEKSDDKETQLKLADVHLCLADVSLEIGKILKISNLLKGNSFLKQKNLTILWVITRKRLR